MSSIMNASPYENVATKGSRTMAHRARLIGLASPVLPVVDAKLKAIYRDGIQIFPAGNATVETEFRRQFEARADVLDLALRIYENALNTEINAGGGAIHWQSPVIDRYALPVKTPGVHPPGEVHYSIRDAQYLVWNGFQWQPSVPNDATWGVQIYDDFITPLVSGKEGWSTNSNGGGSIIAGAFAEVRHPGVMSLRTGVNPNTSRASRFISVDSFVFGAQPFLIEGMFRLEDFTGAAGINYDFRWGFGDNTGNGDHGAGAWFEYGIGTGGLNWFACTNDGVGPPTKVDTLIPATLGWTKLQIWQNYMAGTFIFLIGADAANVMPVASISTTLPSAGDYTGVIMKISKTAPFGAGGRQIFHDYVWGGILLNPVR